MKNSKDFKQALVVGSKWKIQDIDYNSDKTMIFVGKNKRETVAKFEAENDSNDCESVMISTDESHGDFEVQIEFDQVVSIYFVDTFSCEHVGQRKVKRLRYRLENI